MELCSGLFAIPSPSANSEGFLSCLGRGSLRILANYGTRGGVTNTATPGDCRFVHRNCFYVSGGSDSPRRLMFGHDMDLGSDFGGWGGRETIFSLATHFGEGLYSLGVF